jgi:hypothetical protein
MIRVGEVAPRTIYSDGEELAVRPAQVSYSRALSTLHKTRLSRVYRLWRL